MELLACCVLEFLNSAEINAGEIVLSFVLKPAQLGRF